MRFQSIRMRGIRPYREDVHVDLESLPGPIVAIHGPNGAGKSTLVEMLAAGAYRATPTHGKLHTMATTRDAFVEVVVENGKRYTVRHQVDAANGKGESVVTNGAGPLWGDAKVSTFDQWSKKTFPDESVYFAGPFGAQQSEGLLDLTSGERMAVVLRALGIERYESMAKEARESAAEALLCLEVLAARLADEQVRGLDVAEAEAELEKAKGRAAQADAELEQARAELSRVQKEARAVEEARAAFSAQVDRIAELKAQRLAALQRVADLQGQLSTAKATASQGPKIRAAVEQLAVMDTQLAEAKAEQARAGAAIETSRRIVEEAEHRVVEARERVDAAVGAASRAQGEVQDLEQRLRNNRNLLQNAGEIRAAVEEAERLAGRIAELTAENDGAKRDETEALFEAQRWGNEAQAAQARLDSAESRVNAASARLADRAAVERSVADLEGKRDACGVAAQELLAAEEALEALQGQRVAGAEDRIHCLRVTLGDIAHWRVDCHAHDDEIGTARRAFDEDEVAHIERTAQNSLDHDSETVKEAGELPERLREAAAAITAKRTALEDARRALTECERQASRAPDLDLAVQDLEAAQKDGASAAFEQTEAKAKAQRAKDRAAAAVERRGTSQVALSEAIDARCELDPLVARSKPLENAETRIADLERQLSGAKQRFGEAQESHRRAAADVAGLTANLESGRQAVACDVEAAENARKDVHSITMARVPVVSLAAKVDAVARAEASVEALAPQLAEAQETLNRIDADVEGMGELAPVPPVPDVDAFEQQVRRAERAARDAHAAPPVREHALQQAQESTAKVAELEQERKTVEAKLADWTLLADSLGREGIQASEVDAATPELTALTNDLLHTCVGTRWTTTWETTRLDAKGKKQIEECRIRVIDTEDGGDRDGKDYSPGQRAVIELGCSLALTMYACRKLGIERPTLVRDESDAPMTEEASAAYIPMLRRAASLLSADRVLVITHHPRTVELADARILVADGKVEVQA